MNAALLTLALVAVTPGGGGKYAGRERYPLAPSLPLLTEKEQTAIEAVIDRFIEYDVGKLKGAPAAKAVAEFKALGPEAIPALLDGLNKAANLENSCPAVLIAKKLAQLLSASHDPELLEFARGMIGAGVTARRHTVVLKDLKITCQLRKSYLQRVALMNKSNPGKVAADAGKPPRSMTLAELAQAAGSERGPRLKLVLTELEKRKGPQVLETLGIAAGTYDKDIQQHARGLLDKHLARQPAAAVKAGLKADRAAVRAAAARAVAARGLRYGAELIELLPDADKGVRQAARQALVRLSRGQDFGPGPGASDEDVSDAVQRWRSWWTRQQDSRR